MIFYAIPLLLSVLLSALIQLSTEQHDTLLLLADIWQGIPPYFLQILMQV